MQDAQRQTLDSLRTVSQELLESSASPQEFFRSLLPQIVDRAGLQAAAVWLNDDHQRLRLVAEHELSSLSTTGQFFVDREHQLAVGDVMEQVKVRVLPHRELPDGEVRPHALAIGPIVRNDRGVGAIEVFTEPREAQDEDGPDFLHHLMDLLAGYGSRAVAGRQQAEAGRPAHRALAPATSPPAAVSPTAPAIDWRQFDRFVLGLQRLELKQVAAATANDGRLLLGCDRLCVAVREGARVRIRAVSGSDNVHQRANLVHAMRKLADRVLQTGEPLIYQGVAENVPPPLEGVLSDYLAESRMRMVAVLPLIDRRPIVSGDPEGRPEAEERSGALGCLILEQASEAEPRAGLLSRAELIVPHVASALANADQHESILLLPVWRGLGRGVRWFRGRRLWGSLAAAVAIGVCGVVLACVPWPYRVEGAGQVMPVIQKEVFAPDHGDVVSVQVTGGQRVAAGDPLIVLRNEELQAEIVATETELAAKSRQAATLELQADEAAARGSTEEAIRTRGEAIRAQTEVLGLSEKLKVLERRRERLVVRAPATGAVATFQVEQLLRGRPVQRGEKLLEVMDESGDWRLELEIPEHRMGHLLAALRESPEGALRAEYVLATAVEKTFAAEIREADIATRSNQSQSEGAIVEVHARIRAEDLPGRRIGAAVTARIGCGERSLFFVLFGDVVEFVQRHVWW